MKSGANLRLVSGKLTIKIRQFMVVQPPKKHPWRPSTLEDPPKPTQPGPGVQWFIYFWHPEGIFISFPRNSWHIPSSDHSPSPCYDTFSASKKSGHSLWEFGGKHVTSNFHTTQLLDFETQSEILLDQSPSVQIVCSNTAYPRVAWKKTRYPILHQWFSHIKFRWSCQALVVSKLEFWNMNHLNVSQKHIP